jgi:hypothetical protein
MFPRNQSPTGLTLNLRFLSLRIAVAVAVLALIAAPEPVAAKKPGFFCKLAPGKTYVNWRNETQATQIDLAWSDAEGNVIAQRTLKPSVERHFTVKERTPAAAVDFGVAYYDSTGVYAVGGMVCQ